MSKDWTQDDWDRVEKEAGTYTFNEPWMDNINPNLLLRYWRHKGCPGRLRVGTAFGIDGMVQATKYGEITTVIHPDAHPLFKI